MNKGITDIIWMVPKSNHVASIVPPRITEIKVLEPRASRRLRILAPDWVLAVAFSSSERTTLKKGIVIEVC